MSHKSLAVRITENIQLVTIRVTIINKSTSFVVTSILPDLSKQWLEITQSKDLANMCDSIAFFFYHGMDSLCLINN